MASPQPDSYAAPSGAALFAGRFNPLKPLDAAVLGRGQAAGDIARGVLLQAAAAAAALASASVAHTVPLAGAAAGSAVAGAALATSFLWDPPVGGPAPTGYRLYWGTAPGSYPNGPHNDGGADRAEPYSALGLAADTTYYIVARAFNGAGESGNSNEIQVRNGVQIGP